MVQPIIHDDTTKSKKNFFYDKNMERKTNTNDLARLVTQTINHAQKKFADPETKLPPDFILSFSLTKERIDRATYTPILNHWGFDTFDYFIIWSSQQKIFM